MVNNPINELSEDDKNYVFLYDSSYSDDDNHDYDENVDIDSEFEKQINYYNSKGISIYYPSSEDSQLSEKLLNLYTIFKNI